MGNRYWVVKDGYGWRLHFIETQDREFLVDRDGEHGHFTVFESAEAAHKAIEASIDYYGDLPMKIWEGWTVEEFVP